MKGEKRKKQIPHVIRKEKNKVGPFGLSWKIKRQ
jgi:hypothetical protein